VKIASERINRAGKRVVTVVIESGEVLMSFRPNQFYQLGDPLNDVVYGSAILDSWPAVWDQIEQRWIV
jgi:hypothetical protein